MLWMFQRVMFHEIIHEENKTLKDINKREFAILLPLVLIIFWIGIYPNSFLRKMDASVNHLLKQAGGEVQTASHLQTQNVPVTPQIDIVSETETTW